MDGFTSDLFRRGKKSISRVVGTPDLPKNTKDVSAQDQQLLIKDSATALGQGHGTNSTGN